MMLFEVTWRLKNLTWDIGENLLLQIWLHPGWVVSHFHSRKSSECNVFNRFTVQKRPKKSTACEM